MTTRRQFLDRALALAAMTGVPAKMWGAAEALGAMSHEPVEDLTAEAYKVFLRSIEAMYRLGAALRLAALGYKFVKEG